jgi:hypothetical protein
MTGSPSGRIVLPTLLSDRLEWLIMVLDDLRDQF